MMYKRSMKKFCLSLLAVSTTFMVGACSSDDKDSQNEAYNFCLENNGTVVDSESGERECHYPVTFDYDDGVEIYTATCEIETFYNTRRHVVVLRKRVSVILYLFFYHIMTIQHL